MESRAPRALSSPPPSSPTLQSRLARVANSACHALGPFVAAITIIALQTSSTGAAHVAGAARVAGLSIVSLRPSAAFLARCNWNSQWEWE